MSQLKFCPRLANLLLTAQSLIQLLAPICELIMSFLYSFQTRLCATLSPAKALYSFSSVWKADLCARPFKFKKRFEVTNVSSLDDRLASRGRPKGAGYDNGEDR